MSLPMHARILAISFALAVSVLAQTPSQKHPFTFEDMMALKRVGAPVPSPDGKWVVFDCVDVDLAANTKISHLWIVPASGPGAAGRRLNPTPNHEERPRFSPDGKRVIWTSKATDPTQIWMCDFDPNAGALAGKPHQDTYAISPDGQEVAYTSNIDEVEATSTNSEIFTVPIAVESAVPNGQNPDALRTAHATAKPKKISTSPGADTTPLYSPNGKYLAWRSQARAGFEADKWRLLVQDRQSRKTRDLTEKFDRSLGSFAWSPDSKAILFSAEDHGEAPIYSVAFESDQPAQIARLHADDLIFGSNGALYFTRMSVAAPNEIGRVVFTDLSLSNLMHPLAGALMTK